MSMDSKKAGSGLESAERAERTERADDQALWELLGRSRPIEVSPYFTRRVLRDLDAGDARPESTGGGWRAWLRPAWVFAGSTATAALLALGVSLFSFSSLRVAQQPSMAHRQAFSPAGRMSAVPVAAPEAGLAAEVSPLDVDVIADLDNLVAREETNVWTDETSRF